MQQQLQKISFHTFLPLDLENNRLSSGLELERAHNFEPEPWKFDIEPIWTKSSVILGPIDLIIRLLLKLNMNFNAFLWNTVKYFGSILLNLAPWAN